MPNDLGGGGSSQTLTGTTRPIYDSSDVTSRGSFGVPVSGDFLAYLIATFTIGGTIALIQDDNPKAAWVIVVVVLLGMLVLSEGRAGIIENFSNFLRGESQS